ncbi:DUF2357 domain-containing protein [Brevibacillus sp. 179-C9.3 HS]|uniref:DUF2357 domain-containing protein n=1 Tax=unclassified Brevibacillus TaxID=2684853 RepID=UPI0039A3EAD4
MLKIRLENELGYSQDLPLNSKSLQIGTYLSYLEVDASQDPLEQIIVNGSPFELERDNDVVVIPCYFEMNQTCVVQIKSQNQSLRYSFTYSDSLKVEKKSIEALADFHRRSVEWIGVGTSSVDHVIRGIQEGQIPLLHVLDPLTGIHDQSLLEMIEAALPFALNICTKPRQHLRIEEEILDVELVKRIGPAALQHLSSHSEHWRARTITGLVPSRLRAEVYEDDVNIYENLFFRMVIEKLLILISEKDADIKKALAQKNSLIDWDQYGQIMKDYKRSEFLYKLLPKYDYETEAGVKGELEEMRSRLKRLEKLLTTIVSTAFFQGIDRHRKLELPIQPTNIIKMDNRYQEMFKLWNKLLEYEGNQKIQDISSSAVLNPNHYYQAYVQIVLLYSFHLMDYRFSGDSSVTVSENGAIKLNVLVTNDHFEIACRSVANRCLSEYVELKLTEILHHEARLPMACEIGDIAEELGLYYDVCEWRGLDTILFKRKPTPTLERSISNLFKKVKDESPHLTRDSKYQLETMDKVWRKWLSEEFLRIKGPRKFTIRIQPVLGSVGRDEIDLKKNTAALLDGGLVANPSGNIDQSIFVLPLDLFKYSDVKNEQVIHRLINFGEAYLNGDATAWGNYRVGMLPISQTEIHSMQRFIKLLSLHISKLSMEWGIAEVMCPSCGAEHIEAIDHTSWRCKSDTCKVQWGTTRCNDGCGSEYTWIKPSFDGNHVNLEADSPLELLLKKESMFGRLTITDFEWTKERGSTKLVPRCPKCGTV